MNVSPINSAPTHLSNIEPPKNQDKVHHFPREIAIRLRTLNLLAHKIVGDIASSFCHIIALLDQPQSTITYKECETLYKECFINEFPPAQIDRCLDHFFHNFDPEKTFINYKNIQSDEAKAYLWENVISYFCSQYAGFELEFTPLDQFFSIFKDQFDPHGEVILISPTEYKAQLEEWFDRVIEAIPSFGSSQEDEFIELKLVSICQAAILITTLKKVEELNDPNFELEDGYTVQDLFDEIFFLILDLPLESIGPSPTRDLFHQKLDNLNSETLKKKFLDQLVHFLVDPQDPYYEQNSSSIYESMRSCPWLDFELKEIMEKINEIDSKRTSS